MTDVVGFKDARITSQKYGGCIRASRVQGEVKNACSPHIACAVHDTNLDLIQAFMRTERGCPDAAIGAELDFTVNILRIQAQQTLRGQLI